MLLRSIREVRSRGKALPPNCIVNTYRQIQRITFKGRHAWEPVPEYGSLNCNLRIAGGAVWTTQGIKNSRGTQSPEGP